MLLPPGGVNQRLVRGISIFPTSLCGNGQTCGCVIRSRTGLKISGKVAGCIFAVITLILPDPICNPFQDNLCNWQWERRVEGNYVVNYVVYSYVCRSR